MATLQIRKKSTKTWLHEPSDQLDFIIGKFTFSIDGDYFQIVEQGQAKRNKYHFSNITVIDDTTSTTYLGFASIEALSQQLETLSYQGFFADGEVSGVASVNGLTGAVLLNGSNIAVVNPTTSASSTLNQALQDLFDAIGGGSGGSQDIDQTLANGSVATDKTFTLQQTPDDLYDIYKTEFIPGVTRHTFKEVGSSVTYQSDLSPDALGFFDGNQAAAIVPQKDGLGNILSSYLVMPETSVDGEIIATREFVTGITDNKVDKVTGKQLSTEDYTTAEKSKLSGIASGATANSSDASLLNRANHTGTQAISTITGLQTFLDGLQRNIIEDVTDRSHTGSLSETIVSNQLISANTLKTGTILELISRISRSATNASGTIKYYISPNNNSLTGATQIGVVALTNTQSLPKFTRQYSINSSSVLKGMSGTTTGYSDETPTTTAFLNLSLTLSNTYYLITTITLNNGSDTITQEFIHLKSSH